MSSTNSNEFKKLEEKFAQERGLPFRNVLSAEEINEAIEAEGLQYRYRIFTPIITIWAFLSQILSANGSCQETAGRVRAFFKKIGRKVKSVCASAYCQARERIPEALLARLVRNVANKTSAQVSEERLWHGRRVVVVDGSTFFMPDTPANQQAFPQLSSQQAGCGFPIARMVVMFCLITGMVLEMYLAPVNLSERRLFQFLYQVLADGTIVLGDRGCCSYAEIAILAAVYHSDSVFRIHQGKQVDFRRGRWLSRYDHVVVWKKPYHRPPWMSPEQFQSLPDSIEVREIRYLIAIPGFRTHEVTLVTTLLDDSLYPKEELAALYLTRWEVELNLRHLKTTMKMEMLKGKSPEIVRKEAWAYMLAYNLIRRVMYEAGTLYGVPYLRISFKNSLDLVAVFQEQMVSASGRIREILLRELLLDISKKLVPKRHRIEPRRIKRRHKNYPYLTLPRSVFRNRILANNL